jgi:valyl-tRNA synthetase
MIPPPNVTGNLHAGHALQSTLQDLLTRWKRMLGFNALWLPGTDHAGIATQLMVERQLASEGIDKRELGREGFVERAWSWTVQHHGRIRAQLDRLGASCDWSRERFTLDEALSTAVREAFVRLHTEGLISRDEYIVNWSPGLQTAISDLEVDMKEVQGKLYHIAYPVEDSDERIVVATTRPETMLGDTAVAFHPEDDRYSHLHGKAAVLPLLKRRLPFVADDVVDREFGTGLVKVTPSHDPTDFEIGKRHGLPGIKVIDASGRMTEETGEDFVGLDRAEARAKIVQLLEQQGYLVRIEDYTHNVGHCQRSGVPIEPTVSTQWFLDVSEMAQRALDSVRSGRTDLIPNSWDKTWEHWLENIRPWCISRQLWWGHQIPAWYDEDGNVFVAHSQEEAAKLANTERLTQDSDVLDTWFSSALWPFSTLGWPETTKDLETFYPTDVLITGYDIIFFWVARMMMFGLEFLDEEPFHTVHLTGLVRDAKGQKMSKTSGNTVDPLELVDEFGADALRFTLAILDSPGRDIPLDPERMAGYRAFGNKIWNAVRFSLANTEDSRVQQDLPLEELDLPERWIISRLEQTSAEVNAKFEVYRFDEACQRLYHFFWGELCDWYIELCKPAFSGKAPRPFVGDVLLTVIDRSLRLLHPVMPFLTEELWQRLPGRELVHDETITLAPYPVGQPEWVDKAADSAIERFIEIVGWVRALRAELSVDPKTELELFVVTDEQFEATLRSLEPLARPLARLDGLRFEAAPDSAHQDKVAGAALGLVVPEVEMTERDRERLVKERDKLLAQVTRIRDLLENESFTSKAPEQVVEQNRLRLGELTERLEQLDVTLDQK